MQQRLLGVLAAAFLGAAAVTAGPSTATAAPAPPKAAVDFTGIVALSNCSGSLVRAPVPPTATRRSCSRTGTATRAACPAPAR